MTSVNWGKAVKRILLTLALALALTGTFTSTSSKAPGHTPVPLVNWNS